jgi:hypothetical protein
MITNGQKTSLLVPSQLPAFIRENPDYDKFVSFLQAYYEWMETNGQVLDISNNLLNYKDIDNTTNQFIDYFINDFLQYFPQDALIDKDKAVKIAKQLYKSKGTPASYQFLFRVLYNSDFDLFYTKDSVFRASSGLWYVTKSLKLLTLNKNFLSINNYRVFGETTKSIAVVENSAVAGNKTEVFISNIERLFQSGEYIRVVNNKNQDVYFKNNKEVPKGTSGSTILRAKLVGQISSIKVDAKNRGLFYQSGDPVIVYGGLETSNGHGAIAEVGTTSAGSILNIGVIAGGYGYSANVNGNVYSSINITNALGAAAQVGSLNPDLQTAANVTFVPTDSIALKQFTPLSNINFFFANVAISNVNTKLSDAFTFAKYPVFPISSILLTNGGGGIKKLPVITASSLYKDDVGNSDDLANIGILAPIQINSGGQGYELNDTIIFAGGSGYGAQAEVSNVDSNGTITSVTYTATNQFPLGGMGYRTLSLPTVSVDSANVDAYGASLYVPNILGAGATFSFDTDKTGAVSTISILDNGEDYVSKPNVSLKIQDIIVSNVSISQYPRLGDIIFQGVDVNSSTYRATVNNAVLLLPNGDPAQSLYNLRVFEYNTNPDPTKPLKINNKNVHFVMANIAYNENYNTNGIRTYGDGRAIANAAFLNGLVISEGQYLNKQGQPSSFSVLQSSVYNNYTYQITVEKEISKYKDILLNLLHPSGMQLLGRYVLKSNGSFTSTGNTYYNTSHHLSYYTNDTNSHLIMEAGGGTGYYNVVEFYNMDSVTILDTILPGTTITFTSEDDVMITSEIASSNSLSNTVTLKDSTWLTSSLTAYATNITLYGNTIFGSI